MNAETIEKSIRVDIASDALSGELRIVSNANPELVTQINCLERLRQFGVQINSDLEKRVENAVARFHDSDEQDVVVELAGRPAVPGRDGRIDWSPGCDPAQPGNDPASATVSFYDQTAFVTLKEGQVFARVVPPSEGEHGFNIRGEAMIPKVGKAALVGIDNETVKLDADGRCTALRCGVLHFDGQKLSVEPVLNIDGFVDFSTGNIEFSGDVVVAKGVRDRFRVRTTGDIEVGGLVEAAELNADRDIRARGGIASKEAGTIRAGRDLFARYLEGVRGQVRRNAFIEREMIQCALAIEGALNVEHGSIIGGQNIVTAEVIVKMLGSPGEVPTELRLGCCPTIEKLLAQVDAYLQSLDRDRKRASKEMARLQELRTPTADDRERQTELMCLPGELEAKQRSMETKRTALVEQYDRQRAVSLTVHKTIFPRSVLFVEQMRVEFTRPVSGPIWIGWNARKQMVARTSKRDAARPVSDLPGVEVGFAEPAESSAAATAPTSRHGGNAAA